MKWKKPGRASKAAYTALVVFTSCFAFLAMNCKNQSTAPNLPDSLDDNSLKLSCNPIIGGTGIVVDLNISFIGNSREIKSFGLEMTFDPAVFQYQGTHKSDLTASWASVDGNETSPGKLIIGGFTGSGNPVPAGSSGSLAIVKIKVIYNGSDDGFSSSISIKNYSDDIVGLQPEPSSTSFTFKK